MEAPTERLAVFSEKIPGLEIQCPGLALDGVSFWDI
jgi:hypothetical protein